MRLNTKGLIIREQRTGEADRLVTVLTPDYGVLRAFVRGARNIKSKLQSATQLLSYSRLSIYRGRDAYIIDEAEPIEVFFTLRNDIEKLALAQYISELLSEFSPEEAAAKDHLRLALNSFYLLCGGKKSKQQIKAIAELRLVSLAGYMPNLTACEKCGKFENGQMLFDMGSGLLYCQNCPHPSSAIHIESGVLAAMRHICFADFDRLFNFSLPEKGLDHLNTITERYTQLQSERKYKTLDFYNSLRENILNG